MLDREVCSVARVIEVLLFPLHLASLERLRLTTIALLCRPSGGPTEAHLTVAGSSCPGLLRGLPCLICLLGLPIAAFARLTFARLTLTRLTLTRLTLTRLTFARLTLTRLTFARLTFARLTFARLTLTTRPATSAARLAATLA